jgi:hypothetical protein
MAITLAKLGRAFGALQGTAPESCGSIENRLAEHDSDAELLISACERSLKSEEITALRSFFELLARWDQDAKQ